MTLSVLCPEVDRNGDGLFDGLLFSTGPFKCTATIRPPAPKVEGDCWNWSWTFELWAERPDPATGELRYQKIAAAEDHILEGVSEGLYDIHYIVEDVCGEIQRQECSLQVIDESGQVCKAEDAELVCSLLDFDPEDKNQLAARFGTPWEVLQLESSCSITIGEEVTWTPSDCGAGIIERHFTVTTAKGFSSNCVQTIRVEPQLHYRVRFPVDDEVRDCRMSEADAPSTEILGCDLLALTQDTVRLAAPTGGACYNLAVKHQLINWCEYEGGTDPTPIVLRQDSELDKLRKAALRMEVNYDNAQGIVLRLYQEGATGIEILGEYTMAAYQKLTRGFFEYTQVLRVYDNTPPQINYGSSQREFCVYGGPDSEGYCGTAVRFTFSAFDNCSAAEEVAVSAPRLLLNRDPDRVLTPAAGLFSIDRLGSLFLVNGQLPLGVHRFIWTLTDACGNTADRYFDLAVKDCLAPRPSCVGNQVIGLLPADLDGDGIMESGANTVWANDLVKSTTEDCSMPVQYSINRVGEKARPEQAGLTLTCDDPIARPIPVEVHAWDAAGNHDYCEMYIVLEDDGYWCTPADGGVAISGSVTTENGNPVAGVEFRLSGSRLRTTLSETDGSYNFGGLHSGYDYSIRPWLDKDILNGVSTYDLVLISRHILGKEPLKSPYKLIAADLNNSGTVTTLDLVELRRLVLSVETEFRNNASWRFIDASYVFPNPANPWVEPFPEIININDLNEDRFGLDFIAVKIGDVSGNAQASIIGETAEVRGAGAVQQLYIREERLMPGRLLEIPLYLADPKNISGCQFTLEWDADAVDLMEIVPLQVKKKSLAVFRNEEKMTVSWVNEGVGDSNSRDEARALLMLFTLKLKAKAAVPLRRVLQLSSHPTRAESYDFDGTEIPLELNFQSAMTPPGSVELLQNRPNPFQSSTTIGFELQVEGRVQLSVSDAAGKVVYRQERYLEPGRQEWALNRYELPSSGLFFYTLETAAGHATRQMMVMPDQ